MILDGIILSVLIYGFIKGIREGLFIAVARFLSFAIGVIVALKFSNIVKVFLAVKWGWEGTWLSVFAFLLTLLGVIYSIKLLAKMLTEFFKAVYLGVFNRMLGGVFEVLRIIFFVCILLGLFVKVNSLYTFVDAGALEDSLSFKYYTYLAQHLLPEIFELVDVLFDKGVAFLGDKKELESI